MLNRRNFIQLNQPYCDVLGETRAAMSDGASSGDEVSISDSTIHVASSASSFTKTASLFPSNIIKMIHSSLSYWESSEMFLHYIFKPKLHSRSIIRLLYLSLFVLVSALHCRNLFVLFWFPCDVPSYDIQIKQCYGRNYVISYIQIDFEII